MWYYLSSILVLALASDLLVTKVETEIELVFQGRPKLLLFFGICFASGNLVPSHQSTAACPRRVGVAVVEFQLIGRVHVGLLKFSYISFEITKPLFS